MRKLLIIGSGYLGTAIKDHFADLYDTTVLDYPEIDITDASSVEAAVTKHHPDIVINAAGYTDVDGAEKPENKEKARQLNVEGPANLGRLAQKHHFYLVHLSTGMMFDSPDEKRENATPNPTGYYAQTKAEGDAALTPLMNTAKILITRIHLPVSRTPHPKSLLTKLTRYDKGSDGQNSITIVEDYVVALQQLIEQKATGIYHVVNPGSISTFQIMQVLQKQGLIPEDKALAAMNRDEMNTLTDGYCGARRPDSILNTNKLQSLGIKLPEIHQAIEQAVQEMATQ